MYRLLVVEDDEINLALIKLTLQEQGYQLDEARDGEEALQMINDHHYDLLVLDRKLPKIDGLSVLRQMKNNPKHQEIPVIIQTALTSKQDVQQGLLSGAYYYLTKPFEPESLAILVKTVLAEIAEKNELRESKVNLLETFKRLDNGTFTFRTLDDARQIAVGLSYLCNSPETCSPGIAELLINAVEHGNLGITYAEKSELMRSGTWQDEIERRLKVQPWSSRQAQVSFHRQDDKIKLTISDEGAGFDWNPYLEFDPNRVFDLHGRGIAMTKLMGYSVEYQGNGNTVQLTIG